ncbi:ESCRT-III subunit protein SNF7 [Aspergillus puulaauensis]|uniref:Vacuolar-sorting protein SNF7 n=1 Tax=Aspergillus puulaauensis TaxID=1220207 RepID=A0A7R7XTX9_9EURO|nr:ESCRT-III subunit protein snf7 [Aspergillus puulaauensis]BCS27439.1 ESCRT-III subunit protein snf7 [Aspergillus puulaauensis]
MWSWFGGAAAQKRKDAPKNAILALREQLDMLQKREKHLENQMAEQEAVAKKNVASNKTAAKAALRRKKVHEKNFEQTQAQVAQLEQQIYAIEAANINHETLNAMKMAGTAMEKIHNGMTIDKVDETMDKLREQAALNEEIAQVIANNPLGEQPDEDELDEELEGLEQEAMDERMLNTGTVPVADQLNRLPAPTNAEPAKAKQKEEESDEEAELEKLRAEMAM